MINKNSCNFELPMKRLLKTLLFKFRYLTSNSRKLPDFIIIGTQKGGTSSLFYYLRQHPDVKASTAKEVHYFDLNYNKGLNWYKSFFPLKSNTKITGEASPYYLFHPHVPARIKKDIPNVKLIVMLRDPAKRAFSHYKMERRNGQDPLSTFEEAIEKEYERTHEETVKLNNNPFYKSIPHRKFAYAARGLYYEQINNWLKYFDKSQFYFIKAEEFYANPQHEFNEVCKFLNLETVSNIDFSNRNEGAGGGLSEDTYQKVKAIFAEDNIKLANLIGEKFNW